VKLLGDKTDYLDAKTNKTTNYGVVVAKSLQWPGSYTCFS
jgi:hypothetical protein